MFWGPLPTVTILAALPLLAAQAPPEPAIFHTGTRLVEVEVIVRDKHIRPPGIGNFLKEAFDSGPPFGAPGLPVKGLTKNDFTLFDDGNPQPIAVFRERDVNDSDSLNARQVPLPPGTVSNRTDRKGKPLAGATVVLLDLLGTEFESTEYERLGLNEMLKTLKETNTRVAIYTLGEKLHILHDFTDDPQKLLDIAAHLNQPHGKLPQTIKAALHDYGDLLALEGGEEVARQVHGNMTVNAMRLIFQHLSLVPGRKNLIWLLDNPMNVPPAVLRIAQQANIVVYPVMVRTVPQTWKQEAARNLAAVTGARAFFDARDLSFAVQTADEDSSTAYVLGYYPTEEMLDGKYHKITLNIHGKPAEKQSLSLHYRTGYIATKIAVPPPAPIPQDLFQSSVNSAGVGITATAIPEPQHDGRYDLRLSVDLHDIQMTRKDDHFSGAFDVGIPDGTSAGSIKTGSVVLHLTDQQFAAALDQGFNRVLEGIQPVAGEIRVVVRDRATGAAGSLRVPIQAP